nr:ribosomal protein S6 [Porphyrostromium japonicum]
MINLKNKKNINTYETILIVRPENTEEDTDRFVNEMLHSLEKIFKALQAVISVYTNTIEQYSSLLRESGAIQVYFQNKGRHHLTYLIKKHSDGIYIQSSFKGNGRIVKKLEKVLRFDEKVMRHLTIKQS